MTRDGSRSGVGIQHATLHLGQRPLRTLDGVFEVHFFRDLAEDRTAMAIVCGDIGGDTALLARVHSSCLTSECLMGCDCDCAEQLSGAMSLIARAGRGIIFYLMQEGRGAGLSAKARDRMIVQASGNRVTTFEAYAAMGLPSDLRRYDAVASMAQLLGVGGPLQLLTNNPEKAEAVEAALVDEKVEVCGTEPIYGSASSFNSDYLRAKQASGHALPRLAGDRGALPPSRVNVFEPAALREDPSRVVTASYFLPILLPILLPTPSPLGSESAGANASAHDAQEALDATWFRLSVIFESETARELILLSQGDFENPAALTLPSDLPPLRLSLFDRIPRSTRPQRDRLTEALCRIREAGVGKTLIACDESVAAEGRGGPENGEENGEAKGRGREGRGDGAELDAAS